MAGDLPRPGPPSVLLGDGSLRPFAGGRQETPTTAWFRASLAAGLVLLLAIVMYHGTRRRL